MEQRTDIRRTDYGHLPALAVELHEKWKAYASAEDEFERREKQHRQRALRAEVREYNHLVYLIEHAQRDSLDPERWEWVLIREKHLRIELLNLKTVCSCGCAPGYIRVDCPEHGLKG